MSKFPALHSWAVEYQENDALNSGNFGTEGKYFKLKEKMFRELR